MTTETLAARELMDYFTPDPTVGGLLATLALPAQALPHGWQVDHTVNGRAYARSVIVSASQWTEYLQSVVKPERFDASVQSALRALHDELFDPRPTDLDLYVYFVGDAPTLARMDPGVRYAMEFNMNCAMKRVVTLAQLSTCLTNPFADATPEQPAVPTLELLARAQDPYAAYQPTVAPTLSFQYRDLAARVDPVEVTRTQHRTLRRLTDTLYQAVMGQDTRIFWNSDSIELGYDHESCGSPFALASRGEQLMFSLALFLARASLADTPPLKVGIYDAVTGLDTIRMLRLLDVLRDFMLATGVSVLLQSEKSDPRALLKRKCARVMTAAQIQGT